MNTQFPQTKNPREAAYLALLASLREERFIIDTLEAWQQQQAPTIIDYRLAQQLAFGACQMALTLDYIGSQLSTNKKLSLKQKERGLLRLALYQCYFLERIPTYAIADEMVKLASIYCHRNFVGFLNALLRNLPKDPPKLPTKDLSICYSYPVFYVKELLKHYGLEKTTEILIAGNKPAIIMARVRNGISTNDLDIICRDPCTVVSIKDASLLPTISSSQDFYIQNITPALLISQLCQESRRMPEKILDLCASPGGKLLAVHDVFPKAALYANDVSQEKLQRLSENCSKYGIEATLSCSLGQEFATDQKFDIIIIDAPCSNTGVLNKRPEARWRLSPENLSALESTQLSLISHVINLLSPQGEIWYMTCSILPEENENLVGKTGLQCTWKKTYLPNADGYDGGFAAKLQL